MANPPLRAVLAGCGGDGGEGFQWPVHGGTVPETICTDNIHSLAMVFGAVESAERGARVALSS